MIEKIPQWWLDTYAKLELSGYCDSPGGCECERVYREYMAAVAAGSPPVDVREFIIRRANADWNGQDHIEIRRKVADMTRKLRTAKRQARDVRAMHGCTVGIWRDGSLYYVRCHPDSDREAIENGWKMVHKERI